MKAVNFKLKDILDLIIFKDKKELEQMIKKHNLTNEDINKMNIALKEGNWRMI